MQGAKPDLTQIPSPADRRIALQVKPAAERALRRGHPWLFADAIEYQSQAGNPGDLSVVFDSQRKFLAIGLYDPTSQIRVRVLQHRKPALIDQGWFGECIKTAAKIRSDLPEDTNGYRLIHGENDGLPGLVVDRYAQSLVLKLYTPAWIPYLTMLIPIFREVLAPQRMILRLARGLQNNPKYLYNLKDGSLIDGTPSQGPVMFQENGITFEADLIRGQKTGFFLDQRDNRARVEDLSKTKTVLNVFAFTGGFSVYAARGGAKEVLSLDISQPALEAAQRNFAHNRLHPAVANCLHETLTGDAFELLHNLVQNGRKFEMVILDPPTFAKNKAEVENALKAYHRLTRLGLAVLAPDGIFVQASCSSRVTAAVFFEVVHQAARQIGRPLKEIERTGHALDHPIAFPEGEYLKCLFATG